MANSNLKAFGKLKFTAMLINIKYERPALTLLELLVVLTILIALGGIVVASLPGLLSRTQAATGTANVTEIDRAIERSLLVNQGRIGNRFDSLVVGATGLDGEIASYVGGRDNFQAASLNPQEVNALALLGITELIPALANVDNATFNGHLQPAQALGADSRVCQLAPAYAELMVDRLWNVAGRAGVRYLVFGLGQRCTLVGAGVDAVFKEAPVHFSDNNASNPNNMYARYLIIVELDGSEEDEPRARYVGVAIPDINGITGLNDQLKDFYSNQ